MAKVGVNLKIDVTKIDKERLFKGQKGTYLDATVFIDMGEADQYGNHGMITQQVSKEEKDNGTQGNILGNCRVFWTDNGGQQSKAGQPPTGGQAPRQGFGKPAPGQHPTATPGHDDFDEDIPF